MKSSYTACQTSIGTVHVAWTERGVASLHLEVLPESEFLQRVQKNLSEPPVRDDSRQAELTAAVEGWLAGEPYAGPIDLESMTPFTRTVLAETSAIPRGQVRTYSDVARAIGRPRAARAVGGALSRNPVLLLVPCHRVVPGSGVIGNYSGGGKVWKERLLRLEGAEVVRNR